MKCRPEEILLDSTFAAVWDFARHHVSNVAMCVGIAKVQREGPRNMRQGGIEFLKGILKSRHWKTTFFTDC